MYGNFRIPDGGGDLLLFGILHGRDRLEQTLVSRQTVSPVEYTKQEEITPTIRDTEIPVQKGRPSLWQRYGLGLLLGAVAVIVVLLILLLLQ